ncbi:hypothetical protein AB1Y20_014690 [Prymnesium parvum]|uniref:Glycosyltransferase subfamily 4-like N-terminal domain-containing protein n=1 Tax=Prymnesium parvum TaxID=97485 RepID=A0AB34IE71_PRYPA
MSQRLIQIVRALCRLSFDVYFLSGQPTRTPPHAPSRRASLHVGGCRVTHFTGSAEQQYASLAAARVRPLFALVFYTAAWFAVEQRAIANATAWERAAAYAGEEGGGAGGREGRLLELLRREHRGCAVVVLTDDLQAEKLARVLPASKRAEGDGGRVAHVVRWMRRRELSVYAAADAVVTVSEHDASWIRRHLRHAHRHAPLPAPLVRPLPFAAYPPPPARVPSFSSRAGLLFIGVAHTSAALSMRWFLRDVRPRLHAALAASMNSTDADRHAHLTLVGWGWKQLAREGPGCSAESQVVGRSSRCVGAADVLPDHRPSSSSSSSPPASSPLSLAHLESRLDELLLLGPTAEPAASRPQPTHSRGITLLHSVDDDALGALFASRRLFVAPCPFCTGVATKVVTALRHGIPVVSTRQARGEAMRGIVDFCRPHCHAGLSVHDEPDAFASAARDLLSDEALWTRHSKAALHFARTVLSEAELQRRLRELLHALAVQLCAKGGAEACEWAAAGAPPPRGARDGSAETGT